MGVNSIEKSSTDLIGLPEVKANSELKESSGKDTFESMVGNYERDRDYGIKTYERQNKHREATELKNKRSEQKVETKDVSEKESDSDLEENDQQVTQLETSAEHSQQNIQHEKEGEGLSVVQEELFSEEESQASLIQQVQDLAAQLNESISCRLHSSEDVEKEVEVSEESEESLKRSEVTRDLMQEKVDSLRELSEKDRMATPKSKVQALFLDKSNDEVPIQENLKEDDGHIDFEKLVSSHEKKEIKIEFSGQEALGQGHRDKLFLDLGLSIKDLISSREKQNDVANRLEFHSKLEELQFSKIQKLASHFEESTQQIRSIPKQVGESLKLLVKEIPNGMKLSLDPPEWGSLTMKVESKNGQVQVTILAEHQFVKDALERSSSALKQSLEDMGLSLGELHVGLGEEHGGKNPEEEDLQYFEERQEDLVPIKTKRSNVLNSGSNLVDEHV